jgi:hypothetical protein
MGGKPPSWPVWVFRFHCNFSADEEERLHVTSITRRPVRDTLLTGGPTLKSLQWEQDSKDTITRCPQVPPQPIPKPHTNRRTDEYAEGRMKLLKRLFTESGEENPALFRLSVKLNSGDYIEAGGSRGSTGISPLASRLWPGRFRRDLGGNAEQKSSGVHNSFSVKLLSKAANIKESTRTLEAQFTGFAEMCRRCGRSSERIYVVISFDLHKVLESFWSCPGVCNPH